MADDAGEKTEEPTGKRTQDAINKGNVSKSRDLSSGVFLLLISIFLYFYFPSFVQQSEDIFIKFFDFGRFQINQESLKNLFIVSIFMMGKILLPIFLFMYVFALAIDVAQVGFHISSEVLKFDLNRVNFFTNIGKFFDLKRKGMELVKSVLKISVLSAIGISLINRKLDEIMLMSDVEWLENSIFTAKLLHELLWKMALAVIGIGAIDYIYQQWQRNQDLKMTKQEVKEEHKQMEGDPLVKQRIRQAQQEAARKRMMDDVQNADAVVANPTHYAVAIKYIQEEGVPRVVAKGQRLMALRIKELAREHGVYIHEDPPLAQMLYKTVDVGDQIPENLYKAVAEILAIVFKMKNMQF